MNHQTIGKLFIFLPQRTRRGRHGGHKARIIVNFFSVLFAPSLRPLWLNFKLMV